MKTKTDRFNFILWIGYISYNCILFKISNEQKLLEKENLSTVGRFTREQIIWVSLFQCYVIWEYGVKVFQISRSMCMIHVSIALFSSPNSFINLHLSILSSERCENELSQYEYMQNGTMEMLANCFFFMFSTTLAMSARKKLVLNYLIQKCVPVPEIIIMK